MNASFIHLRLHSEYSLVDGLIRIKSLVQQVAAGGMPAVALTDMGNMFALIKFYKAALSAGIKPIIGAEVWVQRGGVAATRLVLLCQNRDGYRNLTRLVSRSYVEGQERDAPPTIQYAWLAGNTDGLIALSAGRTGELGQALLQQHFTQARRWLSEWKALFPQRFYLEVQRSGHVEDEAQLQAAVDLALETHTPLVATNEVCFLQRTDFAAHEARVCIHQGTTLDDAKRPRLYTEQQYLRSAAEMLELFADLPEALQNTVEIAKRCNLRLELGKNVLPDFPTPDGSSAATYFTQQAQAGLEQRLQTLPAATPRQPYDERLALELRVIIEMGFAGYFLIVADFIQWARDNQVPVGPGRGSGAGSLVAYALGITDLDPLQHELLFERFLNPERVSMPDFDIDFCMEGRDRVIDYVAQRYGRGRVAQIATHGSMAAKAVVRDVGRVLGHSYGFVDRIAKLIPFELGMTLEKALHQEAELRRLYESDDEVMALLDLAQKLEGLARNVGTHAGGVVIAPTAITDFAPLYCEAGELNIVTQFDKDDVEAAGLVKFDFLGLRTLTVIDWAVQAINQQRQQQGDAPLDINHIAMDDAPTFRLLKRYETTAIFQLESSGMKDLIRRLQPDCFEDLVALVALFRPGPLQSGMVDDFIDRKHGRARIEYPHPALAPILRPTYGVILYQEQVMQIAQVLAGYSLGGADLLRRAMGKKKPEEMAKQRETFVTGAVERGAAAETASYIFDLMEKFAGYGFNRSHSAAYALLSYQTAWLKTHYPAPFMAAVLSADMDKIDKLVIGIEECRRMKLNIAKPNINQSAYKFTATAPKEILYGLGAIKGVGANAVDELLAELHTSGSYQDLFSLCQRIAARKITRRVLELLIRSGALDDLAVNRATLMAQLPDALQMAEQFSQDSASGQDDLFGLAKNSKTAPRPLHLVKTADWTAEERLRGEKETLGIYLSGHPLDGIAAELRAMGVVELATLRANNAGTRRSNSAVLIAGLVTAQRTRNAQRGGRMAFVTLDDGTAQMEVRIFPEVYERDKALLSDERVLLVQGQLSWDDFKNTNRLNVERILDWEEVRAQAAQRLCLKLSAAQCQHEFLQRMAQILTTHHSAEKCVVWVEYRSEHYRVELILGNQWRVKPSTALLQELRELLGADAVRLDYTKLGANSVADIQCDHAVH